MVYTPVSTIRYEYSSESEKNVKTTKVNNTIIIKYPVNKYRPTDSVPSSTRGLHSSLWLKTTVFW